jgi:hypothetical protein
LLCAVALAAFLCSLSPTAIGGIMLSTPSSWLYDWLPMFRSYARFGVAVQLMVALLAGVGFDALRRSPHRWRGWLGVALLGAAAFDYAFLPSTQFHALWPTQAHQWVMRQSGSIRAFDCARWSQQSASVAWLAGGRIASGSPVTDCTEPNLAQRLSAEQYTHLIVTRGVGGEPWPSETDLEGLVTAARFDAGQVLALPAPGPALYTADMTGLFAREHDAVRHEANQRIGLSVANESRSGAKRPRQYDQICVHALLKDLQGDPCFFKRLPERLVHKWRQTCDRHVPAAFPQA